MEKKYDQVQVFKAWKNGASRECCNGGFWKKVIIHSDKWINSASYRIANKTADGLNFHDFIDQVRDDCSNVLSYLNYSDRVATTNYISKNSLINDLINNPNNIQYYSLKKEPKYRACENPTEALEFVGKLFFDESGVELGILIGTDNYDFIYAYKNNAGTDYGYGYMSWDTAFNHYKTDNDKPIGVKRDGADS